LINILGDLGPEFECLEFDFSDLKGLVQQCIERNPSDIILYYSFLPEVLTELRNQLPQVRLYVRTVNAEAFQHWQRSEINFVPGYKNLRSIYGSMRLAVRDLQCKQQTDGLLGISSWDNKNYWQHLPGRAEVFDVPYSSPWPFLRPQVKPSDWVRRRMEIVCLAGGRDAIGRTMLEGFNLLAEQLSETTQFHNWKFSVSPGVLHSKNSDTLSEHVIKMDSLDEPWDLLCNVRALAVLTPLGFGFKTTIADALAAGCHVLVHKRVWRRLPELMQKHCIAVNPGAQIDVGGLLEALTDKPEHDDVVEFLRIKSKHVLLKVFEL
jgi:hypothetical protein